MGYGVDAVDAVTLKACHSWAVCLCTYVVLLWVSRTIPPLPPQMRWTRFQAAPGYWHPWSLRRGLHEQGVYGAMETQLAAAIFAVFLQLGSPPCHHQARRTLLPGMVVRRQMPRMRLWSRKSDWCALSVYPWQWLERAKGVLVGHWTPGIIIIYIYTIIYIYIYIYIIIYNYI